VLALRCKKYTSVQHRFDLNTRNKRKCMCMRNTWCECVLTKEKNTQIPFFPLIKKTGFPIRSELQQGQHQLHQHQHNVKSTRKTKCKREKEFGEREVVPAFVLLRRGTNRSPLLPVFPLPRIAQKVFRGKSELHIRAKGSVCISVPSVAKPTPGCRCQQESGFFVPIG